MKIFWVLSFSILIALAIPWFLWGDSTTIGGLPVWIWWHIGWMILAAIVFGCFTARGWDLFIKDKNGG